MKPLIKISRISYGVMMGALAIQQMIYASFRPVIVPPFSFPGLSICVYAMSIAIFIMCVAICIDSNARTLSLILGAFFLLLFLVCHVPFEFINDPYYGHLGSWTSANKELVFAGGGFVVAGSYPATASKSTPVILLLERLIPWGSVLMCITMISFGIDHFLYTKGVASLVPTWLPWPIFWTDFAGAALVLSGITIILKIQLKLSALLLSLMIFLWLLMLHIPRAVVDPYSLQGNEVSSVFEAFGFSGIAYLIAYGYHSRRIFTPAAASVLPETYASVSPK
jgi:uncharacterized membrane protein YphA (DoxX/SURF4 family)